MALLLTKKQAQHFCRNIPRLVLKIWDELSAIDNKITSINRIKYVNYHNIGTLTTKVNELDTANKTDYIEVRIPADSAANDTWERSIFKAPNDGTIEDVIVIPDSDIGQATNYMTLDVQDKGEDGTGTTSLGSRAVNSTNTIEGMVGVDLVTTNADIDAGRVLSLKKTVTETGQSWPGGIVQVKFTKA